MLNPYELRSLKSVGWQKPSDFCHPAVMCKLQLPDTPWLFLIQPAKHNYQLFEPKRKRGKPVTYSARSFWLLNLAAVLLRAFSASELHLRHGCPVSGRNFMVEKNSSRFMSNKAVIFLTPKQFSKKNKTWKNDLFEYRKETIELLFQRVIQATDIKECKVKGLDKKGAFVLASVWLYQISFLVQSSSHQTINNYQRTCGFSSLASPNLIYVHASFK